MSRKLSQKDHAYNFLIQTSISRDAKCVALVFAFVAHDEGWSDNYKVDLGLYTLHICQLEARIVHVDKEVLVTQLSTLRFANFNNQVLMCTV